MRLGSTWTTWMLWWWSTRHSATTLTPCLSRWVPLGYWSSNPRRRSYSRSEGVIFERLFSYYLYISVYFISALIWVFTFSIGSYYCLSREHCKHFLTCQGLVLQWKWKDLSALPLDSLCSGNKAIDTYTELKIVTFIGIRSDFMGNLLNWPFAKLQPPLNYCSYACQTFCSCTQHTHNDSGG